MVECQTCEGRGIKCNNGMVQQLNDCPYDYDCGDCLHAERCPDCEGDGKVEVD